MLNARSARNSERKERQRNETQRNPRRHYGRGILPFGFWQVNSKSKWLSRKEAESCSKGTPLTVRRVRGVRQVRGVRKVQRLFEPGTSRTVRTLRTPRTLRTISYTK